MAASTQLAVTLEKPPPVASYPAQFMALTVVSWSASDPHSSDTCGPRRVTRWIGAAQGAWAMVGVVQ